MEINDVSLTANKIWMISSKKVVMKSADEMWKIRSGFLLLKCQLHLKSALDLSRTCLQIKSAIYFFELYFIEQFVPPNSTQC